MDLQTSLVAPFEIEFEYVDPACVIRRILTYHQISESPQFNRAVHTVFDPTAMKSPRATSPKVASNWSAPGCFAIIAVLGGSFFHCLATLWNASCFDGFDRLVPIAAQVDPSEVAESVSGILLSDYLSLFGLAGFSLASLLWYIAKGPANDADVENTSSRGNIV